MTLHPLEHAWLLVQVVRMARTPIEMYRALDARLEHVAQYRLQRREARTSGDHEHGSPPGTIAELSDRPLDAQQRSDGERRLAAAARTEQALGEATATHPAHVQLDDITVVRRARDGEAAPLAAGQQHIEVLPGMKAQALHRGQTQQHLHHIGGESAQAGDPAGKCLDLDVGDAGNEPCLDREVRPCTRLAQENEPAALFLGRDARGPRSRIADLALEEPRATGAAVPGLAAVRQVEPGGERGLEHRLILAHVQGAAVRLDSYAVLVRAHCPRPVIPAD